MDSAPEYPPSPVPSDADLEPGELPFTAFGQWGPGMMDNRVFDQDVWWVNIEGTPFRLTNMSPEYRANVIAFLQEHADYFHAHAILREVADTIHDIERNRVGGALLGAALGVPSTADLSSQGWLESTPLMRRLRAMANTDSDDATPPAA